MRMMCYSVMTQAYSENEIPSSPNRSMPVSLLNNTSFSLTETLGMIIPDITKTESNNCFIIHCFKGNNDKRIINIKKISTLALILFCRVATGCFFLKGIRRTVPSPLLSIF